MKLYEGNSADEAWRLAHADVSTWVPQTSRNGATRETLRAMFVIQDPRRRWVLSRTPPISPALAIAEVAWILAGDDRLSFITPWNRKHAEFVGTSEHVHGAYGRRLRRAFGVDQILGAASALRNAPDSRQVVLQLYDPRLDLPSEDGSSRSLDIPCNVTSLLKIRSGRLEWTQILRSNDLYLGVPYNFVQFTVLQEAIAGLAGVDVGSYGHLSDSLHAYERDANMGVATYGASDQSPTDDLRLSPEEFLPTVETFRRTIESLGRSVTVEEAEANLVAPLPRAWLNMALICGAERVRRLKKPTLASQILGQCTNLELVNLQRRFADSRNIATA